MKRFLLIAFLAVLCAARSWAVSATGGVVTNYTLNSTNFTAHIFTNFASATNITFSEGGSVEVLVVAGGGAGGKATTSSGGGGAGGLLYTSLTVSVAWYPITVGSGGVAKTSSGTGASGANSSFSNLVTATGGGGGGGSTSAGGNGGSGGGAQTTAGTGIAGQGKNGGTGTGVYVGGGGGAGSVGTNGSASTGAGHGGTGMAFDLSGVSLFYAGGGGGCYSSGTSGNGGSGVGGNGGASPTKGMDGRGGGGGGGGTSASGPGGSGVVIVRYVSGGAPPATYTISYHSNLATSGFAPDSQIKTQGVSLVLRANTGTLERTGYTFLGWNTASNGSGTAYATGATYTADADATMYADWQTNTPPSITVHPTNYTVYAGQRATFAVTATGTPTLLYQWYTNGILLVGATAPSYTTAVTVAADSGTVYKVVVTNSFGFVESSNAVLSVLATNRVPEKPTIVSPSNTASGVSTSPTLTVSVSDPDGGTNLSVVFYGRAYYGSGGSTGDFTIVHIPDSQNYFTSDTYVPAAQSMTDWIVSNRVSSNIVAVYHVGDVIQNGGTASEFIRSTNMMYRLSDPTTTGLADGMPWTIIGADHDDDSRAVYTTWNNYYGTNYFRNKSYWGGSYTSGNEYNYILISAGGMNFIILGLSQYADEDPSVLAWASNTLWTYRDRKALVVTHSLLNVAVPPDASTYSAGGPGIYDMAKWHTNVFLITGGHTYPGGTGVYGHGYRTETNTINNHVIELRTADYQNLNGFGDGYFRLMRFRPSVGVIDFWSYSPWKTNVMDDSIYGGSQFSLTNSMLLVTNGSPQTGDFVCLGTNTGVTSGQQTSMAWGNLTPGLTYQWYAVVSDGTYSAASDYATFTTGGSVVSVRFYFYRPNGAIRSSSQAVRTMESQQ